MVDLVGIGSILGGLGGLFGGKKTSAQKASKQAIVGQADGARLAADLFGFNPLTLLGASSPVMGSEGGPPPLASMQMLLDGFQSLEDERTGKKAQQRQKDQLELDLAKLRLEQARSGVIGGGAVNQVGSGRSSLGPGHAQIPTATDSGQDGFGMSSSPLSPEREKQVMPVPNSPGFFEMENRFTGGPINIPGDSEPWGIDELVTAAFVGVPQVAGNWAMNVGRDFGTRVFGDDFSDLTVADFLKKSTWDRPAFVPDRDYTKGGPDYLKAPSGEGRRIRYGY